MDMLDEGQPVGGGFRASFRPIVVQYGLLLFAAVRSSMVYGPFPSAGMHICTMFASSEGSSLRFRFCTKNVLSVCKQNCGSIDISTWSRPSYVAAWTYLYRVHVGFDVDVFEHWSVKCSDG
jgi:hypothetical protein